jgi:hypothetical protein
VSSTRRGVLASVLAWLAGAALAIAVGTVALSSIGGGSLPDALRPLPPDDDVQAVPARPGAASSTSRSPSRSASASAAPGSGRSPTGGPKPSQGNLASPTESSRRVISTSAGSVVAECRPLAYLVSWSPEPGYQVESVQRGPTVIASVRLRSTDKPTKIVVLNVKCADGVPQQVGAGNGQGDGDPDGDE